VRFLAEFRSRSKGPEGEAVDDRRTAEVWTFQRNLTSRDPNWTLIHVDPAEAEPCAGGALLRPRGPHPGGLRQPPASAPGAPSSMAALPGWDAEDHAAAFARRPPRLRRLAASGRLPRLRRAESRGQPR